mgnify:FL=1
MIDSNKVNKTLTWLLEVTSPVQPQTPPINQPIQQGLDINNLDQMVRGPEDGVKSFIDKIVDIKNKELGETSKHEISKLIQNA